MKFVEKEKNSRTVLLSFVGNRDPYNDAYGSESQDWESRDDPYGPVLSLLSVRSFNEVILFCTGPAYLERALGVEHVFRQWGKKCNFTHQLLELDSVIDYEEIYKKLSAALKSLQLVGGPGIPAIDRHLYVLLDPGTPQMQTCWFLLVRSGDLRATLLQGVPPRFGGGSYRAREIDLDRMILPQVVSLKAIRRCNHVLRELEEPLEGLESREDFRSLLESNTSAPFREVLNKAFTVARYSDVSVLLRGEPGTGKELLARLIHAASPRKNKPFVAINCSALTPSLVESELFGHTRGAFTGAARERAGKFRAADGGTILLDEVGDLPLDVQPKLLRVLQERTLHPVGSEQEYRVDVRVLAATNRDLEAMLEQGTFRRDLYDRLNQVAIHLPPLRERKSDIPLLAKRFVEEWNQKYKEDKFLSKEVLDLFYLYHWPGNVRELQNTIIALCASSRGAELKPENLPPPLRGAPVAASKRFVFKAQVPDEGMDLRAFLYQAERFYYEQALRKTKGNREKAALLLGINPPAFRKALKERFPELLGKEEGE